jgi:CubicO group peptidase (beta-lactamase class C family)
VADADQLAQVPPLTGTAQEQRLQFTAWALGRAPAVQPGHETEYSNGGYVAAAAMLERVAGRTAYETLMQQKLFQPLGMTPAFGTPGAGGSGEAWGHVRAGQSWSPLSPDAPGAALPEAANPAGGVKLSGQDLARFLQLHVRALRGDTGLLITPQSAQVLHAVVQDGYALGWADGSDGWGHPLSQYAGSDDASYYGLMALRRDAPVAAAVLVNAYGTAVAADVSAAVNGLLR